MQWARLDVPRPARAASEVEDEKSSLTLLLCKTAWLSGGIAPLAWWLAATSRWRTTSPLRATSDQTCLLQSIQKTKVIRLRESDYLRLRAEVLRFHLGFGGDRRRTYPVFPPRINGLCPGSAGHCFGQK